MIENIQKISNHLQFLGYEIEQVDEHRIVGNHARRFRLIVSQYDGGTELRSIFAFGDLAKSDRLGFLNSLNHANSEATICRYFASPSEQIHILAWYLREYDRLSFGLFLDLWDSDTTELIQKIDLGRYIP